jgi:membrane-associated phospholipid phosphatase
MTGTTGPGNEEPGDAAPVTPPAAGALGAAPGSSPAPRYAGAPPGLSRRRFVAAALLVAGFVVMLVVVMRSTGPPAIDVAVQRWFQDRRTPLLTTVFRGVTDLGSPVGLIITVAVVAGALSVRRRSWRPLLISAVTLGGAELIGTVIKILVGRDRPPLVDRVPDVTANRLDFPSGHSTQSAAAYTILMLLIAQQVPHRIARVLLYAAAAVGAGLVGASRLYLGVHWFTDVAASWLLGAGWAITVWAVAQSLAQHQQHLPGPPVSHPSEAGTSHE